MRDILLTLSALMMACSGHDPTGPAERVRPGSAVASVTIEPQLPFMNLGSTLRLKVFVRNASGHELTGRTIGFTSSNERVVSVDRTGLVRALAEGTATLTAISGGKRGQTTITVIVGGDACGGCWDYSPSP